MVLLKPVLAAFGWTALLAIVVFAARRRRARAALTAFLATKE